MIAIDNNGDRLSLRFDAGKMVSVFAIAFPLVALAGLSLLVFLPRTATLSCSRVTGMCASTESSLVASKTKGILPVAELQGAHVDRNGDGTRLVLETARGSRDLGLGRRFDVKEVTTQQEAGADAIKQFVADASAQTIEISVPRRHGENAIWGGVIACMLFGLGCWFYRRSGTLAFSRDTVTWESKGILRTYRASWPLADIRGVKTTMPSYYEAAVVLELAHGKPQMVIRQYRSAPGQRDVDAATQAIRTYLTA